MGFERISCLECQRWTPKANSSFKPSCGIIVYLKDDKKGNLDLTHEYLQITSTNTQPIDTLPTTRGQALSNDTMQVDDAWFKPFTLENKQHQLTTRALLILWRAWECCTRCPNKITYNVQNIVNE